MRKLSAAILLYLGLATVALAQSFGMPPPAGVQMGGCVFNTTPPTLTNGQAGFVQCGSGGGIVVGGAVSNANSGVLPSSTNLGAVAYNYLWNGGTWDQAQGIAVGTAGVPATDVLTVQPPASNGTFPPASTPVGAVATGTTGSVVATMAATALVTNYLCEFDISAIGGTAAVGPIVVAGLVGGSRTYQLSSLAAGVNFSKSFNPCLPASAINTAITITTTADGTATAVDVNASGYRQ